MASKDQPIIGVTCGTGPSWNIDGGSYRSYAGAVEKFGAKCVPLDSSSRYSIDDCDGLLITGGWDVHPDHYNRMPGDENLSAEEVITKYKMTCEPVRDSIDLKNFRKAIASRKPFLGICRGFQVVNIALAGQLVPDIPSCVPKALAHAADSEGVSASHIVTLQRGSLLYKMGSLLKLTVNSRHHQGVTKDMVPECARIAAIAPDGVVEAMEMIDYPFGVAVQWHPEREKDRYIYNKSQALFCEFVSKSRG